MPTTLLGSLGLAAFAELCDGLPAVIGCAKGTDGCYVYANRSFAVRAGRKHVADVIGRRAEDLFHPEVAMSVAAQDDEVLRTGRPLQNHLETIVADDGTSGWWLTSKARFLADDGTVLGVVCMSVAIGDVRARDDHQHRGVAVLLHQLKAAPATAWRVDDMATTAGVTRAQLERLTDQAFGLSPTQLLMCVRVDEAMHLLTHSTLPLVDIAAQCGYYDQSDFTRQFRAATGVTPGTYRADHPYRFH